MLAAGSDYQARHPCRSSKEPENDYHCHLHARRHARRHAQRHRAGRTRRPVSQVSIAAGAAALAVIEAYGAIAHAAGVPLRAARVRRAPA